MTDCHFLIIVIVFSRNMILKLVSWWSDTCGCMMCKCIYSDQRKDIVLADKYTCGNYMQKPVSQPGRWVIYISTLGNYLFLSRNILNSCYVTCMPKLISYSLCVLFVFVCYFILYNVSQIVNILVACISIGFLQLMLPPNISIFGCAYLFYDKGE